MASKSCPQGLPDAVVSERSGSKKRALALKLTVIARQLRVSFDQRVESRGFTRSKWTLTAAVARNPGATQRIIAEALEINEITVGRLIDRLCTEGILERRQNPQDSRAYSVHLAAGAQPILDELDALAMQHEADLFTKFHPADLDALDTLLDAISRNLSAARRHDGQE